MSQQQMPASSSEPRRWKKKKRRAPQDDDAASNEEDDDVSNDVPNPNPVPPDIVSGTGTPISDFPAVVRHTLLRHHPSVLAVAAGDGVAAEAVVRMENLSHGQMETVSRVPREGDDVATAVAPPEIVGGKGVVKRFAGRVLVVPMHSDWFSTQTVHRLERQVVPHFFSGNSAEYTPENYMEYRNRIVSKYMESPEKKLSLADCQGWVTTGFSMDDLTRIVRFLDHWGIINYCASTPIHEPQSDGSFLREDSNGEIQVPSVALKSIDSLIQFEKPKCKLKISDIYPSLSCNNHEEDDLDSIIREHLSENRCYYCSNPVPIVYYQSQKEADLLLCLDCYNNGRFVTAHSSIDFVRIDTSKDYADLEGESWTNQETLLLLEAMEIYNDNWNQIAQYVGSKSIAQCMLHFIRLPTDDGPLENVEIPSLSSSSNKSNEDIFVRPHSSSNGDSAGYPDLESELPFANSANPVMSLVAFLASAVGPRVAAACAHACLAVLSEDPQKEFGQIEESGVSKMMNAESVHNNRGYSRGEYNISVNQNGEVTPLSADKVKSAVQAGLAAAATKAKLFADHEEREIQRSSANIINHQLKKLELKLKQFADVETLLMKESDQMEKKRQNLAGERFRMMSVQFGNAGGNPSLTPLSIANNAMSNMQPMVTGSSQPFFSSGYINNQQQIHPHMTRQPQMYGNGPRLPLSALHPSSSASVNNLLSSDEICIRK